MKSFSDLDDDFGEEEQLQARTSRSPPSNKKLKKEDRSDVFEDDFGDEMVSEAKRSSLSARGSASPARRQKSPSSRQKKALEASRVLTSRMQQSRLEGVDIAPLPSLTATLARQKVLETEVQRLGDRLNSLQRKNVHRAEQQRDAQQRPRPRRFLPRSLSGIHRALERELKISDAAVEALIAESAHLDQQLQQANSPEVLNELNQRIAGLNDTCKTERATIVRLQGDSKRLERQLGRLRPEETGNQIKKLMIEVDLQLQRNNDLRAQIERFKLASAELDARLEKTAGQIEAVGRTEKVHNASFEDKTAGELQAKLQKHLDALEKNLRTKKFFLQRDCQLLEAKNKRFHDLNNELDGILERQTALVVEGADFRCLDKFLKQQPGFSPLKQARKQSAHPKTVESLPILKPMISKKKENKVNTVGKNGAEGEALFSVKRQVFAQGMPAIRSHKQPLKTESESSGAKFASLETNKLKIAYAPAEETLTEPGLVGRPPSVRPVSGFSRKSPRVKSPDVKMADDELEELLVKPEKQKSFGSVPGAAPDDFDFLT